jgi:hypothetical protein
MTELDAFKAELRAAGQPWSRRGVWAAGAGIVFLTITQLAGQIFPSAAYFFALLGLALALLTVGWAFFVVAFVKRRRWAKAHPVEDVPLPEAP